MKIDQSHLQPGSGVGGSGAAGTGALGNVNGAQGGSGTQSGRGLRGHGNDSVELSGLSAALRGYSSESPERASALEALAKDVQGGRYSVDAKAVSRSIVNEALLQ